MEEEKAAAYYDEVSRKGSGAARFKQGLGFSNNTLPSSTKPSSFDKQSQLQSIHNKLNSKSTRSRSRSRERDRLSNSKHPSRERDERTNSKRRTSDRDKHRSRSRSPSRDKRRSPSRSRELRRRSRSRSRDRDLRSRRNEKNGGVDYTRLIPGYHKMAPAERVKAKIKLQLTETAKKDPLRGTGSGWERFDFDKDATLDDEEIEAAEDDSSLVKHIGQSFRFSAVEARKEDQIKAAHDEAMFGAPSLPLPSEIDEEKEELKKCTNNSAADTSLISNQVILMQQVSWRDRVKKM